MVTPMLKKAFPSFWPWKTWFFTFENALLFINIEEFTFAYFSIVILFDIAVGIKRIWCVSKKGVA